MVVSFASDAWVIGRGADDPAGEMCMYIGQVPEGGDLSDLDQATIQDGSGEVVAIAAGEAAKFSETPERTCARTYVFSGLPTAGFFTLHVGPYTSRVLAPAEIEAGLNWQLNP